MWRLRHANHNALRSLGSHSPVLSGGYNVRGYCLEGYSVRDYGRERWGNDFPRPTGTDIYSYL